MRSDSADDSGRAQPVPAPEAEARATSPVAGARGLLASLLPKRAYRAPLPKGRLAQAAWFFANPVRIPLVVAAAVVGVYVAARFAGFVLGADYFALRDIEVVGASRLTPEAVITLVQPDADDQGVLTVEGVLEELTEIPQIREADVRREFPSKLVIEVAEYRPYLTAAMRSGLVAVSRDGVVFDRATTGEVVSPAAPLVTGLDEVAIGGRVPAPIWSHIALWYESLRIAAPDVLRAAGELNWSRDGLVLVMDDGMRILIGNQSPSDAGPLLTLLPSGVQPSTGARLLQVDLRMSSHFTWLEEPPPRPDRKARPIAKN